MARADLEWLTNGDGRSPRVTWQFTTEAPLVACELARESGETIATDSGGRLYRLDRNGDPTGRKKIPASLLALAWSDTGNGGVALCGPRKLYWITPELEFEGWVELPDEALAIAIDAHGEYAAAALVDGTNLVLAGPRGKSNRFETDRPLAHLAFLVQQPQLVGVAEQGLIGRYNLDGTPEWQQKLWANAGDLAATASGSVVLVASFLLGVQRFDERGEHQGAYQLDGTISRVATSYLPRRIAAATQERQIFWFETGGQMIWTATAPDDIARLLCDPSGEGLVCAFESGEILRLDW